MRLPVLAIWDRQRGRTKTSVRGGGEPREASPKLPPVTSSNSLGFLPHPPRLCLVRRMGHNFARKRCNPPHLRSIPVTPAPALKETSPSAVSGTPTVPPIPVEGRASQRANVTLVKDFLKEPGHRAELRRVFPGSWSSIEIESGRGGQVQGVTTDGVTL